MRGPAVGSRSQRPEVQAAAGSHSPGDLKHVSPKAQTRAASGLFLRIVAGVLLLRRRGVSTSVITRTRVSRHIQQENRQQARNWESERKIGETGERPKMTSGVGEVAGRATEVERYRGGRCNSGAKPAFIGRASTMDFCRGLEGGVKVVE
jgi:hypothetical protein